ncbi:hypothetical protein BsWGS_10918 [Bradybaena similaris]
MAEYGLYGAMVRHSLPLPEHMQDQGNKANAEKPNCTWLLGRRDEDKQTERTPNDNQQIYSTPGARQSGQNTDPEAKKSMEYHKQRSSARSSPSDRESSHPVSASPSHQ